MKRIGVMGGTFNPIHKGHIAIARQAMKKFKLKEVVFVPSGLPPHKGSEELAPKEDRFNMVLIAIKDISNFSASRVELDRPGYSYAVDTFNELKKEFGKNVKLYYIMGLDSINEILSWRKPLELFKLCEFIVITRPGTKIRTFKRLVKFPPLQANIEKIHLIEARVDISSTDVRAKIKKRRRIVDLVPRCVEEYIKAKKIYR